MFKFVLGITMKLYLYTFILFSQLLIASEKNERDDIKRTLVEYLQSIDQKIASRISEHFYLTEEVGTEVLFSVLARVLPVNSVIWMSSNPFSKSGQMHNQKHTTLT